MSISAWADPEDYIGPTVTVTRHAFTGERPIKVCDDPLHPGCCALVWAEGPLAGRDVDSNHEPRHALGFPYVVYRNGQRVTS